ncbi:uncharacterized protein LOC131614011 [Vicia villosa]|uniref:uncharacterized protein LOC131614011 n=1 Tax=Vicia villosa TaxID=3911 RepID=UPI00273C5DA4|nr:uncharacterized protein LOC131614011 [Vicia villosa]
MGEWSTAGWTWGNLGIQTNATEGQFQQLRQELQSLHSLLERFSPVAGTVDSIVWMPNSEGDYSTRSEYDILALLRFGEAWSNSSPSCFSVIWEAPFPQRIRAFGWRCAHNRIPPKEELSFRGINLSVNNLLCVYCAEVVETCDHLFLGCTFAKLMWLEVFDWLDVSANLGGELVSSLGLWIQECRNKGIKNGFASKVWLAVLWSLWCYRNDIVFNNVKACPSDLGWSVKFKVWKWSCAGNITYSKCDYYDFCKNPLFFEG